MCAAGRRRIARTDGRRIGGYELSGLVIGENLLLALVGHDSRDRRRHQLPEIGDLDDGSWSIEVYARIERLQIGFIHMETFGQRLRYRSIGKPLELCLLAIVFRDRSN